MNRIIRRGLALSSCLVHGRRTTRVISARHISCAEASQQQLQNILQRADQTSSTAERQRLLGEAVELGEKMELPIGHQGRLYDMAANAEYQAGNNSKAEKYFLLAINR